MQKNTPFHTKPTLFGRLQATLTGTIVGKAARLVAATALAAGSLPLMQLTQVVQAAPNGGTITGNVFQDFNSNGVKDTSGANNTAIDRGVAGVTVSAYDASGTLRGTATSTTNGDYTLNASGSGPYRIEFTTLPAQFEPTQHGTGAGTNGTSVQFVADGNSSNINFAINVPCEHCQDNAKLAEAMHKIDFTLLGGTPGSQRSTETVAVINSDANHLQPNHTPAFQGVSFQSNVTQTGGLWGIAWDRTRRSLYVASVFRRETDVGPSGIGGIYSVDPFAAGQNGVPFITISNVGDPRPGGQPDLADTTAITNAGKVGLGGMDISDDDSKLYVMNLNTRRLVQVDIASKTETTSYAVNNPGCANANDVRPWAVKVYRNEVYIGVTCSGETAGSLTGQSAYVMRLSGGTFTTIGSTPLTYYKDSVFDSGNICGPQMNWNPWTNTATPLPCSSGAGKLKPEPMLSSIEFDSDGSVILGFLDRFVYKMAPQLFDSPRSGGDIRRLCNVSGTLVNEGSAGCAFHDADEYYTADSYVSPNWYGNVNYTVHQEIATGGLAYLPGAADVATSAFDPVNNDWDKGPNGRAAETSGVTWMNNTTGARTRGVFTAPEQAGSFGKGGSGGDMEFLCDPAPIEIGNRVWADANGNGIQDPGENGIKDVIVSLQTPTGTLTTQTDANGNYYFGNLRPNTAYSITVAPAQGALNGAQLTLPNANGITNNTAITDVRDSDATAVGGVPTIYYTTGSAGQSNHGLDIGFYQSVSVGNYVWFDTNNNGSVDAGEQPVNGVAVQLYQDTNNDGVYSTGDTLISSTTTAGGGLYNFSNLAPTTGPGTGYLVVLPSSNFQSGGALFNYQNSSSTVAGNSDVNNQDHGNVIGALGSTGVVASSVITLTAGGEPAAGVDGTDTNGNQTIDFGFYQLTLGNQVWVDSNNDGLLNNGEQGRSGVTVQLLNSGGSVIATTNTDANGIYTFTNLIPGTYSVQISLPGGFSSSTGAGEESNPDSNGDNNDNGVLVNGNTVRSNLIILTAGGEPTVNNANGSTTNSTLDFGIVQLASLGNYVWDDVNHDGIQNDGNSGLSNVLVTLYDVNGTPITTTRTDAQGFYSFTNLTPGSYSVGFTAPNGYTFTFQGSNAASDTDSNAGPNGRTATVVLGAGENNLTIDAGLWLPAPSISLKKYTNGFDADVVPGPYLPIGSAVTWRFDVRNTGNVTLTNLTLRDDKVGAITCPQNTLAPNEQISCTATGVATAGQYTNTGIVTGTNPFNPSQPVTSTDPSHYFGSNAGLSIKKYTNDVDADSIPGPFVAAGSTVTWTYIVSNTGNTALISITVSDDVIGAVTCPSNTLAVGASMTCTMTGIAISGQYTNTGTVVGINPNNPGTPLTTNDPSHYFGGSSGLTLKKYVNGNDAQTAPGISVVQGSPVVWTYVMTNTGNVLLTNVALTDDKIGAINCPATELAAGASMTCTQNGVAIEGQYTNIGTVTAKDATNPDGPALTANDPANYFGTPAKASLGNYVWLDVNRDGQQGDPSVEPPLAGITVTLYNDDGNFVEATTTDANGFYLFTPLDPKGYRVVFTPPPGYVLTQKGSDPASGTDSNPDPVTGSTEFVTLLAGDNNLTLDAGMYPSGPAISLKKFVNADDAQTAPGISVQVGSTVNWTYVVKNTGNVALVNVALTDDKEGAITCPKIALAVGEEMTCTKTGTAKAGQYTNIGTVTANDAANPGGAKLSATDPANYFGSNAKLSLKKYTNGRDADTIPSDQPVVAVGSTITWTYVVSNTGNVALNNVAVTDDKEGAVVCPKATLQPGESMTCTKTGIAKAGQYTNLGTVTGVDATNANNTLTSSDPSHYTTGAPQLVLQKSSNPPQITGGRQTVVSVGDRITYTMQVTNNGTFTASNVRISDGIPQGTQYVVGSAVPTQSSGPAPLVWNLGALGPGKTASVSFVVTVINRDPTSYQNTAGVVSNETVTTTSNTLTHVYTPTAVELIHFGVVGQHVQWTTGAELNTFGFAIYRSSSPNRSDARLASLQMIAAKGGNSSYEFVDTSADTRTAYHYWLNEVETTGTTIEYGPVKADVGTNGTDAISVNTNSQLPVASAGVAGGVMVKVDGGAVSAALPTFKAETSVAANALPAQSVSAVSMELVKAANASSEVAQQPDAAAPAQAESAAPDAATLAQPQARAAESAAPDAAMVAQPQARAAESASRTEESASPDAATAAQPVAAAQPAAVVVAQIKTTTHNLAVARSVPNASANTRLPVVVLASAMALIGGLCFVAFMVVRRKRNQS